MIREKNYNQKYSFMRLATQNVVDRRKIMTQEELRKKLDELDAEYTQSGYLDNACVFEEEYKRKRLEIIELERQRLCETHKVEKECLQCFLKEIKEKYE
jgi:hypothetical protein